MRIHRSRCVEKTWWQRKAMQTAAYKKVVTCEQIATEHISFFGSSRRRPNMAKRYRKLPTYGELVEDFSNMNLAEPLVKEPVDGFSRMMDGFEKFFKPIVKEPVNNFFKMNLAQTMAMKFEDGPS